MCSLHGLQVPGTGTKNMMMISTSRDGLDHLTLGQAGAIQMFKDLCSKIRLTGCRLGGGKYLCI